jgi:hypothetical protein
MKTQIRNVSSIKALQTVSDVEEAMSRMDKIYGTSFYEWLKNEHHLDQIAFHCKRILEAYDEVSLGRGLAWLTKDWNTNKTAELLIKMFYHWGMSNPRFARVVSSMLEMSENKDKAKDIILTLVIGEEANVAATFIHSLTQTWETKKTMKIVEMLATRLEWSMDFFQSFLITFTNCMHVENKDENFTNATIKLVKTYFKGFKIKQGMPVTLEERIQELSMTDNSIKVSSLSEKMSHLPMAMAVLHAVLTDFSSKVASPLKVITVTAKESTALTTNIDLISEN